MKKFRVSVTLNVKASNSFDEVSNMVLQRDEMIEASCDTEARRIATERHKNNDVVKIEVLNY